MNRRTLSLATCGLILACTAASSCSSRAADPDVKEVEGVLLRKGSEPRAHWVLLVSDTEQWELIGLSDSSARALQTRRIKVRGRMRPGPRSASLLPTLVVLEFSLPSN